MEEEKMSKQEKNALRKDSETRRQAKQSAYVRDLMNDLEGKPEEVRGWLSIYVAPIFYHLGIMIYF